METIMLDIWLIVSDLKRRWAGHLARGMSADGQTQSPRGRQAGLERSNSVSLSARWWDDIVKHAGKLDESRTGPKWVACSRSLYPAVGGFGLIRYIVLTDKETSKSFEIHSSGYAAKIWLSYLVNSCFFTGYQVGAESVLCDNERENMGSVNKLSHKCKENLSNERSVVKTLPSTRSLNF